jgi:hypothetical protein
MRIGRVFDKSGIMEKFFETGNCDTVLFNNKKKKK